MFRFRDFKVLLDYAHNPAGLRALQNFLQKMEDAPKVGIIAGIGDRRDEDNREIGAIAAEMFDEVIIRQDKNLRGRTEDELISLMKEGIESIDKTKPVRIIPSEEEAITHAIKNAKKGSLIVLCSDVVPDALSLVMKFKEEEANRLYEFSTDEIPNLG